MTRGFMVHVYRIAGKFDGELKLAKFGGLYHNHQNKIRQSFLLAYIRMAIPYQTAKI